jgi:hypothetical protein
MHTIARMPELDAQLVLMAVPAVGEPVKFMNADAPPTRMPLLEAMSRVDAQLVLMVVPAMREPVLFMLADALSTPTEMAAHAQLVITAVIQTV